jgi:hypothetical protein
MALTAQQIVSKISAVIADVSAFAVASDWTEQDAVINGVMDATSSLWLRTSLETGVVSQNVIWPDFAAKQVNLACFAFAMKALVAYWVQLLVDLDALKPGMSAQDKLDLEHMQMRSLKYIAALDAAKDPTEPSENVWLRVGQPLLIGYYPADFKQTGIVNPAVKSPPDITRPFTLAFQSALSKQAKQENLALVGVEMKAHLLGAVEWALAAPGKVVEGIKKGVSAIGGGTSSLLIGAGAVLAGAGALYFLTNRSRR